MVDSSKVITQTNTLMKFVKSKFNLSTGNWMLLCFLVCTQMIASSTSRFPKPMMQQVPDAPWINLLDSDLSQWEVWMGIVHTSVDLPGVPKSNNVRGGGTPLGLGNDPTNVFSVIEEDGQILLKITGEIYGGLTTKNEYENYHLSMEFKWGTKKWEPRLNQKRDSGILYHCKGEHGAFWKTWKSSLEYQVQEGDCGDYIGLASVWGAIPSVKQGGRNVFRPKADPIELRGGRASRSENFENPNGQWNLLEIITVGDRAIHLVNGRLVNAIVDAKYKGNKVTNGQIQIQSEAAEIYYRDIKIRTITDFPEPLKKELGWMNTAAQNPPVKQADPKWKPRHPSWTDSYAANGFCWCRTSFDHDLDNIDKVSFVINGKKRNIRDICDELEKHPQYRNYVNGDAPYNDIQCGNGPANTAPDEHQTTGCPGRTDKGNAGCFEIGPKWDTAWLESRPRFGGNSNPNPTPTNNGPEVTFAKPSNSNAENLKTGSDLEVDVVATDSDGIANVRLFINNRFIRQENIRPYLWGPTKDDALRNLKAGIYELKAVARDNKGDESETMIVVKVSNTRSSPENPTPTSPDMTSAPIGQIISLKKSGGDLNYVTAEKKRTNNPVIARASDIGMWEQFLVEEHPLEGIALKALSNGKYLQTNGNSTETEVRARGTAPGTWERFEWMSKGKGRVALRSIQNRKWLTADWNTDNALIIPNGETGGDYQTFNWSVVVGNKSFEKPTANFKVFPNPVSDTEDMYLEVTSQETAEAEITLYDISGKELLSFHYPVISGVNSINLSPIRSLVKTKGMYILKYDTESMSLTKRIIVK